MELWYVGLEFVSSVVDISEVEMEMSDVELTVLESPHDEVWRVLNSVELEISNVELAVLDISGVELEYVWLILEIVPLVVGISEVELWYVGLVLGSTVLNGFVWLVLMSLEVDISDVELWYVGLVFG